MVCGGRTHLDDGAGRLDRNLVGVVELRPGGPLEQLGELGVVRAPVRRKNAADGGSNHHRPISDPFGHHCRFTKERTCRLHRAEALRGDPEEVEVTTHERLVAVTEVDGQRHQLMRGHPVASGQCCFARLCEQFGQRVTVGRLERSSGQPAGEGDLGRMGHAGQRTRRVGDLHRRDPSFGNHERQSSSHDVTDDRERAVDAVLQFGAQIIGEGGRCG